MQEGGLVCAMRLKTKDGVWVETENAEERWGEPDGMHLLTGLQESTLYRSTKKKYYIVSYVDVPFPGDWVVRFVSNEKAAIWLFERGYELPVDLKQFEPETE